MKNKKTSYSSSTCYSWTTACQFALPLSYLICFGGGVCSWCWLCCDCNDGRVIISTFFQRIFFFCKDLNFTLEDPSAVGFKNKSPSNEILLLQLSCYCHLVDWTVHLWPTIISAAGHFDMLFVHMFKIYHFFHFTKLKDSTSSTTRNYSSRSCAAVSSHLDCHCRITLFIVQRTTGLLYCRK